MYIPLAAMETRGVPVFVDGNYYSSLLEAALVIDISRQLLWKRVNSNNYPTYIYANLPYKLVKSDITKEKLRIAAIDAHNRYKSRNNTNTIADSVKPIPVKINGIIYQSIRKAVIATNISKKKIMRRIDSLYFPNYSKVVSK